MTAQPTPHWAVRDTLTGTTYRQPNKLIAEKVAAMHGASEVIQVPPPSADEHEEEARELQHRKVEQRLAATVATVQRARTEVDGVVWTDESWRAQRDVVGRLLAEVSTRGALTPTVEEWSEQMDAERARQIEHGYDDAHDAQHGAAHLLNWAIDYARRGNNLAAATMARCALRLPRGTVAGIELGSVIAALMVPFNGISYRERQMIFAALEADREVHP